MIRKQIEKQGKLEDVLRKEEELRNSTMAERKKLLKKFMI